MGIAKNPFRAFYKAHKGGKSECLPIGLFMTSNSNCYLASKKETTVDLKNPLHKSRCTFQKCFHTLPAKLEHIWNTFSDMNLVLLPLLCMNYSSAVVLLDVFLHLLFPNLILLDQMYREDRTKVGFRMFQMRSKRKHDDTLWISNFWSHENVVLKYISPIFKVL